MRRLRKKRPLSEIRKDKCDSSKKHEYKFNDKTAHYDLVNNPSRSKMPLEVRIEDAVDEMYTDKGIKEILSSRQKDYTKILFTGLLKTEYERMFTGDFVEIVKGERKRSLLIITFNVDRTLMNIYFFNRYFIYPKKRKGFLKFFIDWRYIQKEVAKEVEI